MPIEAKDLMIGNYVFNKMSGDIIKVENIHDSYINRERGSTNGYFEVIGNDWLEPIPLTRELLIKCGFDNEVWQNKKLSILEEGTSNHLTINNGIIFFVQKNVQGFTFFHIKEILKDQTEEECNNSSFVQSEQSVILSEVKYLHQLQNVIYILTGEHLNINF